MLNRVELSQYIATKLCHDLAGSLGAISNGLDFITSDNEEMKERAIELIKTSSEQSVDRLVFFRQTYGIAKHDGEANLDELKKVASDYLKASKVTLDFHEKYFHIPDIFISANLGKLILCLIHHAYLNLIHGGEIVVVVEKNNKTKILISARGPSPKLDEEKDAILTKKSQTKELSTKNCISYFAESFADFLKVNITTHTSEKDKIDYEIIF